MNGAEEVVQNFDIVIDKLLPESIQQGLEKACLRIEAEAKQRVPVDDGALRQSITHNVAEDEGEVGTNVEYAPYVEVGTGIYAVGGGGRTTPWVYQDAKGDWYTTSGQVAQPYLAPALEAARGDVLKDFEGLLDE